MMRLFHDIDLGDQTVATRELHGEEIVYSGRYLIAKTLIERDAARVDPLGPGNPLIFSAGPFAGTSFSNANRTSVGCKSPLTGGVKEANGGGSFGYGLGQLKVAGLTLLGASADWTVVHLTRDGGIEFDDAAPTWAGPTPRSRRSSSRTTARRPPSPSAGPSASTRACSRASASATRTAAPRAWPRAAASAQ